MKYIIEFFQKAIVLLFKKEIAFIDSWLKFISEIEFVTIRGILELTSYNSVEIPHTIPTLRIIVLFQTVIKCISIIPKLLFDARHKISEGDCNSLVICVCN